MILPVIAFIVSYLIITDSDKIEVKVGPDREKIHRIRDLHGKEK